jgi:hypothetical protein
MYTYCIRLDVGHNVPDGLPGYSGDARLVLVLFSNHPDKRWHHYGLKH